MGELIIIHRSGLFVDEPFSGVKVVPPGAAGRIAQWLYWHQDGNIAILDTIDFKSPFSPLFEPFRSISMISGLFWLNPHDYVEENVYGLMLVIRRGEQGFGRYKDVSMVCSGEEEWAESSGRAGIRVVEPLGFFGE